MPGAARSQKHNNGSWSCESPQSHQLPLFWRSQNLCFYAVIMAQSESPYLSFNGGSVAHIFHSSGSQELQWIKARILFRGGRSKLSNLRGWSWRNSKDRRNCGDRSDRCDWC
jgi:hypothetical protein